MFRLTFLSKWFGYTIPKDLASNNRRTMHIASQTTNKKRKSCIKQLLVTVARLLEQCNTMQGIRNKQTQIKKKTMHIAARCGQIAETIKKNMPTALRKFQIRRPLHRGHQAARNLLYRLSDVLCSSSFQY